MNCFHCRHVDTGGDNIKCWADGEAGKEITKEVAQTGCKLISCLQPYEEEREFTQIAAASYGQGQRAKVVFGLCNDRTLWSYGFWDQKWTRIPGPPQD